MCSSYLISFLLMTIFIFFRVIVNEVNELKNILASYEKSSVQAFNLQKFEFFYSRNVVPNVKNIVANILGVQQILDAGKYLELPSMIG